MATTQIIYGSLSAITYLNLPISGLTEGNNINISGSNGNFTISVTGLTQGITGNYLPLSGGTVSGSTNFTNGLTSNTISASTITLNGVNFTGDTYVTGLTFNTTNYNLTVGRNDGVSFTDSLAILSSDLTVTGGTYNANTGIATFTNNTGGTFNVTGFITGLTDTYVTGGTYSNGTATFTNTSGSTFNVSGFTQPFSGGSGNCITDFYVTNIHGCSPITIYDSVKSTGATVSGSSSFSFGLQTSATTDGSHAKGDRTLASGNSSHAEGLRTIASGDYSHAEGGYYDGFTYYAGGTATGMGSHAEGQQTLASGLNSHSEGYATFAYGNYSHAEGSGNVASGETSHAEGASNQALGGISHAEGELTTSLGIASHAEGRVTTSLGYYSHAEGDSTISLGTTSHAEGNGTIAAGDGSHAEGYITWALGDYSHTEGRETIADGNYQHVMGLWNATGNTTQGAFIIGNGINDLNRSNLLFAAGNEVNISGKTKTTTLQITSGATNGYVLTSDGSGNASWQPSTGGGSTFTGGTVTGPTTFTNGLTATTISATTYQNLPSVIQISCSDEVTTLTTGTTTTFRIPYNMTLTEVRGSLTTAQVSGNTFTVDVLNSGTTVLSTLLTIDNTQKTSKALGTTQPVISTPNLIDDDEISVAITQIGNGTARGLKVTLIGNRLN